MYSMPYLNNTYNAQANIDRINAQMAELEEMKKRLQQPPQQPQQPTNLTQNFQLAPTSRDVIRYATSIEEVQRDMVIGETPYFSKDMSVVWIKNLKGEIRTYELNEIVPKDEKDLQIELLQTQINELRKEMKNNERINSNAYTEQNATDTSTNDKPIGEPIESTKSANVSKVSRGKKE